MSAKIIDEAKAWLLSLTAKNGKPPELKEATYDGKKVYVYQENHSFVVVSYTADGKGMFSIKPEELC